MGLKFEGLVFGLSYKGLIFALLQKFGTTDVLNDTMKIFDKTSTKLDAYPAKINGWSLSILGDFDLSRALREVNKEEGENAWSLIVDA